MLTAAREGEATLLAMREFPKVAEILFSCPCNKSLMYYLGSTVGFWKLPCFKSLQHGLAAPLRMQVP